MKKVYEEVILKKKTIVKFGFVGCEELCRFRRMLSTEADNILLDLHNPSHLRKAEFNNL